MAIIYVTQQGATIRHIAGRIIVRREDKIIQEVPDFKVEQIIIFGNIQLTSSAITYCVIVQRGKLSLKKKNSMVIKQR
ncbi:MAG: CRISPR-associated endonuclease Cas1 [Acidobacteria bacterium]|nr:CRISPR-associated endonuclease Cas1 [Acidobacteriota bacterium]